MRKSTSLAWLIVNVGTPDEIQVEITKNITTLGRESGCDIQLSDPLSSSLHAVIYFRNEGYEIEDHNSKNGTFVNDVEVTTATVSNGDLIRIGNTTFLLKTDLDPDTTIHQDGAVDETRTAIPPTSPPEHSAVFCQDCGHPNSKNSKICSSCGSTLPQFPPLFQKTQEDYKNLQVAHQKGKLNEEDFHAALSDLVIQDDEGDFWMLGIDSGEWYRYDGEDWHLRNPPLMLPGEEFQLSVQGAGQIEGSQPSRSSFGRWGAVGLWIVGVLIVLVFGVYTTIELTSFSRTKPEIMADPYSSNLADETLAGTGEESEELSPTATAEPLAQESRNEIQARPYDPSKDGSLPKLYADAKFLADQSTEYYEKFSSNFHDTSGYLLMGWCAIDQDTLNNNLSSIQFIGTFDGVTIPAELWFEETSQDEDMVCQIYRTVVEELEPGTHRFFYSTRYDVPINDGWNIYPPGTYINEFTIEITNDNNRGYLYQDDFMSDGGHWGELDLGEVRSKIDGGVLYIKLNQPSINAINHFQDRDFDDFTITAYAQSLSENTGMYGIVFRVLNDQNYYYFQVLDQGYFRFGKIFNEPIEIVPWTTSTFIHGQGESNKLTVTMEGDRILAYINDQEVVDLRDSTFRSGGLGLIAGSPAEYNGYHAAFDQVSIEAPE